jgi:hypothetical protein
MYYIGLDVHKKTINHCVKDGSGRIYAAGSIPATRLALDLWMKTLPQPWTAAMEATIFAAWIYDHLQPNAAAVKAAHLQTVLIEEAKMAPRNSPELAMLYDQAKQKGNANRATLAVVRKMVAYLVAVDRWQKDFLVVENKNRTAA